MKMKKSSGVFGSVLFTCLKFGFLLTQVSVANAAGITEGDVQLDRADYTRIGQIGAAFHRRFEITAQGILTKAPSFISNKIDTKTFQVISGGNDCTGYEYETETTPACSANVQYSDASTVLTIKDFYTHEVIANLAITLPSVQFIGMYDRSERSPDCGFDRQITLNGSSRLGARSSKHITFTSGGEKMVLDLSAFSASYLTSIKGATVVKRPQLSSLDFEFKAYTFSQKRDPMDYTEGHVALHSSN